MTIPPTDDGPGARLRLEPAAPHADRPHARSRWRALWHAYPGIVTTIALCIAAFLTVDGWLLARYRRYREETTTLRASMSDVERRRTDAILSQNENRVKVMVQLFKRQAKVDQALHLSVSLDSAVMYLERDGALLREMPITVGPEKRVGLPPDTVHIAAPRGKRTIARVLGDTDVWAIPRWLYSDRGIPAGDSILAGALGPAAIVLDGGTVIYSLPSVGPLNDSSYVLPGAIRVRAADLKAIAPNLTPGVAVYFY